MVVVLHLFDMHAGDGAKDCTAILRVIKPSLLTSGLQRVSKVVELDQEVAT